MAVALNVNMTNKKSDNASLLALANVEALAGGEVTFDFYCRGYQGICFVDISDDGQDETYYWGEKVNNPN